MTGQSARLRAALQTLIFALVAAIDVDVRVSTVAGRPGTVGITDMRKIAVTADGMVIFCTGNQILARVQTSLVPLVGGAGTRADVSASTVLANPQALALSGDGSVLYYVDKKGDSDVVRRVDAAGNVVTVFGTYDTGAPVLSNENLRNPWHRNFIEGTVTPATKATEVQLKGSWITDIAVDPRNGTLYVADPWNFAVYAMSPEGFITSVIGVGDFDPARSWNGVSTIAEASRLQYPFALAVDPTDGDLYITDFRLAKIVRVDAATGIGHTVAGGPSEPTWSNLGTLRSLAIDPRTKDLYFSGGSWEISVLRSATGLIETIAGEGYRFGPAADGFPAKEANLGQVLSLAVDPSNGDVYFLDRDADAIRVVRAATGMLELFADAGTGSGVGMPPGSRGDGGSARAAALALPSAVDVDPRSGDLYIADQGNHLIRKVSAATGVMTTIAGQVSMAGYVGDNGPATQAKLYRPAGVAVHPTTGDVFIADTRNNAVRLLNATTGRISTIVGGLGSFAPGGTAAGSAPLPASQVKVEGPTALLYNAAANELYISESRFDAKRVACLRLSDSTVIRLMDNTLASAFALDAVNNQLFVALADENTNRNDMIVVLDLVTRSEVGPLRFSVNNVSTTVVRSPNGLTVGSNGDLFISTKAHAIYSYRPATGVLQLIAGKEDAWAPGSEGVAAEVRFNTPLGIAFDRRPGKAGLFVADSVNGLIRHIRLSEGMDCPEGFYCRDGRNLVACDDPSTYCPLNSVAPVKVRSGSRAVGTVKPAATTRVYTSQDWCPVGYYCPEGAGLVIPCPGGSYGTMRMAQKLDECTPCSAQTYLADTGRTALADGSSPCLPCPLGSEPNGAGSTMCKLCPPNTYRDASSVRCTACPAGHASLYGAAACFKLAPAGSKLADGLALVDSAASFERFIRVQAGNAGATEVLSLTLRAGLPFLILLCIPYILLMLYTSLGLTVLALPLQYLKMIDQYKMKEPKKEGDAVISQPTVLGGAISTGMMGVVLVLMISTVVQFDQSNTLLQQSVLPTTLTALGAYMELPLTVADTQATADLNSASMSTLSGKPGFSVTLYTMGSQCANLKTNITSSLLAGSFVYSRVQDAGGVQHIFKCSNCFLNDLSQLSVGLDSSCQGVLGTVSTVGVAGGLTSSTSYVSNRVETGAAPLDGIAWTFPVGLEVIQDSVKGSAPRAGDGLVTGGRSSAGFVARAASVNPTAVSAGTVGPDGILDITIALPLESSYTLYQMVPKETPLSLFSSLSAFLGILGAGSILLGLHEKGAKAAAKSRPLQSKELEIPAAGSDTNFEPAFDSSGAGAASVVVIGDPQAGVRLPSAHTKQAQ